MLIFLVGFMGCGKSTIGRRVARRLGYEFVDTDAVIEQSAGMTVREIFARHGEGEFRRMERKAIEDIPAGGNVIVATGGGAPCFGDNMEFMKARGSVVYFKASPESLSRRLEKGKTRRPKIANMEGGELLEYIRAALLEREPCYSRASAIIDCEGVSDEYIASHIVHFIENSSV